MLISKEIKGVARSADFINKMTAKKNVNTVPISKSVFTEKSKMVSIHSKKIPPLLHNGSII